MKAFSIIFLIVAIPMCFYLKEVKWCRYRSGVVQRVGRGIAPLFHDRGTRRGSVVSSMPRPHFTPGKTWYLFYRRLVGLQGRSGREEDLVPTGIRSPDHPARSQSLHRLSYPVHDVFLLIYLKYILVKTQMYSINYTCNDITIRLVA